MEGEAPEAGASDVHGRVVGGHAQVFVQFTDPKCLVRLLAEGVQDGPAGGGRLGWFGFFPGWHEFGHGLPGHGRVRRTGLGLGLGQSGGQLLDLVA